MKHQMQENNAYSRIPPTTPSVDKALGMPELHVNILRFLGPLDWLKCAAVCRRWSVAILDRNDYTTQATRTVVDATADRSTQAGQGSGGQRAAAAADIWREFAMTVMHYDDSSPLRVASDGGSCNHGRGGVGDGGGEVDGGDEGDRDAGEGGQRRSNSFLAGNFYETVCLEGDPLTLGQPLSAESRLGGGVAIVWLKDMEAASQARSRKPRALVRFLRLWARHGPIVPNVSGDMGRPEICTRRNTFELIFPGEFGTKDGGPRKIGSSSCYSTALPAVTRKKKNRKLSLADGVTAMLNDGLREFTRRTVLCRRCRRQCTALYATEGNAGHRLAAAPRGGAMGQGKSLSLWVECLWEGCCVTSEVPTDGGPVWLVKFAKFVLRCKWKDINTIAADHGTEWFSDTSPEAVQLRREEARASSAGLDALARRIDVRGEGL